MGYRDLLLFRKGDSEMIRNIGSARVFWSIFRANRDLGLKRSV